jgi:hypothetical protein
MDVGVPVSQTATGDCRVDGVRIANNLQRDFTKRTSSGLSFACAITFVLVSASAHAVIYQAESFNNAYDTTADGPYARN